MAHARAFSFTDDAISVKLPAPAPISILSGGGRALPDASVYLFKLRCLQSGWYQTLLQSDPSDPLPDATSFIWESCLEMRRWSESLPSNLPAGLREKLDLELRYSYVYCIAPSSRAPHITEYGRLLIFEHAIAYIHGLNKVAHSPVNTAFYTYHDALRVYFMGCQFFAVLRDAADMLLSGSFIPPPLVAPGKPPPPPPPERIDGASSGDNLDRSLRALQRVSLALGKYGERWESAMQLMQSFEMMSAEVIENLRARQRARDSALIHHIDQFQPHHQVTNSQGIPNPPQQPVLSQHLFQQQQQHQEEDITWMQMNAAQFMRGSQA